MGGAPHVGTVEQGLPVLAVPAGRVDQTRPLVAGVPPLCGGVVRVAFFFLPAAPLPPTASSCRLWSLLWASPSLLRPWGFLLLRVRDWGRRAGGRAGRWGGRRAGGRAGRWGGRRAGGRAWGAFLSFSQWIPLSLLHMSAVRSPVPTPVRFLPGSRGRSGSLAAHTSCRSSIPTWHRGARTPFATQAALPRDSGVVGSLAAGASGCCRH